MVTQRAGDQSHLKDHSVGELSKQCVYLRVSKQPCRLVTRSCLFQPASVAVELKTSWLLAEKTVIKVKIEPFHCKLNGGIRKSTMAVIDNNDGSVGSLGKPFL